MRRFIVVTLFLLLLSVCGISFSQGEEVFEKTLVLREAKQLKKTKVGIEAYLLEDILEVAVEVRMYAERPKIVMVMLTGPGIGRVYHKTKEDIPVSLEEDDPYLVTKLDGEISFSKRTKEKKLRGTLTKELYKFKVPVKKIKKGKRYQLWVEVESKRKGGRIPKFKFDLEELPELVAQEDE